MTDKEKNEPASYDRAETATVAVEIGQQPPVVQVVYAPHQGAVASGGRDVQCCYPIATADPAETAQARNVAILHVCLESVGILFCRSESCFWAALFAIPSSSTVACCCKTRWNYAVWGFLGVFVFCLHVAAASTYAPNRSGYFSGESSGFNVMVQIVLSFVSMLVAHFGIRMYWRLRNPILPAEVQLGAMEVAPPSLNSPAELQFGEARRSP